jgi:type II secretory pathway component GspD/PulD (secretin)
MNMHPLALAAVCAGVVCLSWQAAPGGPASGPAVAAASRPASQPGEQEMVQLEFPKSVQVKTLIDYISQRMKVNFLYDEAIVHKAVTINSPSKVPKESLMGLFESVLKISGLMMVDADQPGWKRIVPSQNLLLTTKGLATSPVRLKAAEATEVISPRQLSRCFPSPAAARSWSPAER